MLTEDERQNLLEYLQSGKHLPECLQDFHDAKDVFKCVGNSGCDDPMTTEGSPDPYAVNWVQGQIYCIDKFLWFMAAHGYTLQRSRKKLATKDLNETIETRRQEAREITRQMMESR